MKAVAVFPGERRVDIIDVAEPILGSPTDVKVRVLEVGVCGTDKEICAFEYGTPPKGSGHLVIGHECLAEVVEVGQEVTRVKIGDLVVPMVRRPCPHETCVPCRAGRQDFCTTGDFKERGIKEAHGFMTEFVVDDERYMNVVPRALREVGVLVEPLTIAEKALAQVGIAQQRLPWGCPVTPGRAHESCHTAVVLGAGPVGLLGALALANAGFDTWVYSRASGGGPDKKALAGSFGGRFVAAEQTPIAELAAMTGNIDLVYEAVGASRTAFEMLGVLGVNGVFVFTGVPGRRGPVEVDTDALMRNLVLKNQMVFGTVNAGRDIFEAAIADLATFVGRWPSAPAGLITGRFPITAYRDLLLGRAGGIKNVLTFGA